jgi:hypothetical protein
MTNGDKDVTPTIGWICIDAIAPAALAEWWSQLLGAGTPRIDQDGDAHLWAGSIRLLFLRVPEPKAGKNRIHLDLQVQDYESAVTRAISLGAKPADDVYRGDDWKVLRDPAGNAFCIVRPKTAH